jgi:hypothetical protein
MGQLTTEQIARAVAEGWLDGRTRVWREGRPQWLPVAGIEELTLAVAAYRRGGRAGSLRTAPIESAPAADPRVATSLPADHGDPPAAPSVPSRRAGRDGCRAPSHRVAPHRPRRWLKPAVQLLVGASLGMLLALGVLHAHQEWSRAEQRTERKALTMNGPWTSPLHSTRPVVG